MIEQSPVAVRDRPQPFEEPGKHANVIRIELGMALDGSWSIAVVRDRVMRLGDVDVRVGALAQLAAAESAVETGLKSVIAIAEDYPELRSSDQFLELQAQLEGTENRINVARLRFNEKVRAFNAAIRHLPGSLVAGIGNFRRKAYFQAEEGTDRALGLEYD